MTQDIELQNGIVKRMEIKMRCQNIRFLIVGRMLNRAEIIYTELLWNDNHSRRVLPCRSFNTNASVN